MTPGCGGRGLDPLAPRRGLPQGLILVLAVRVMRTSRPSHRLLKCFELRKLHPTLLGATLSRHPSSVADRRGDQAAVVNNPAADRIPDRFFLGSGRPLLPSSREETRA